MLGCGKVFGLALVLSISITTIVAEERRKYNSTFAPIYFDTPKTHDVKLSPQSIQEHFSNVTDPKPIYVWIWKFNTSEGMRLNVSFASFRTRKIYTILEFGDGSVVDDEFYGTSHTLMARYSGDTIPDDVISVSSSMWMRFKAYPDKAFTFDMTITSFRPNAQSAKLVVLHKPEVIESLGYPSPYRSNTYQLWTVSAHESLFISVIAHDFDLDIPSDYVYIGDTTARFLNHDHLGGSWMRWQGKKPTDDFHGLFIYCASSSSVYILFTSNWEGAGRGFSLNVSATSSCPRAGGEDKDAISTTVPTTSHMATTNTNHPPATSPTLTTSEGNVSANHAVKMNYYGLTQDAAAAKSSTEFNGYVLVWKFALFGTLGLLFLVLIAVTLLCYFQHRKIQIRVSPAKDPYGGKGVMNPAVSFKRMPDLPCIRQPDADGTSATDDGCLTTCDPVSYITRVNQSGKRDTTYSNVSNDTEYFMPSNKFGSQWDADFLDHIYNEC